MSRWLTELVAGIADAVPGGVPTLVILSLLGTALVAVLWYFWPVWLPGRSGRARARRGKKMERSTRHGRRRFRLGRLRFRWRWPWRRRTAVPDRPTALAEDELPDLPAAVLELTADQLAATGRFKEAVRERLRAIVRDLIERQVIAAVPGWTVTELAAAAGRAWPATAAPLQGASEVFSEIWYGPRVATVEDDRAMRGWAERIRAIVPADPVGSQPGDPGGPGTDDPAAFAPPPAEVST